MKHKPSPIRHLASSPSWRVSPLKASGDGNQRGYWQVLTQGLRGWLQKFRFRPKRAPEPMDIKSIEERVRKALYP